MRWRVGPRCAVGWLKDDAATTRLRSELRPKPQARERVDDPLRPGEVHPARQFTMLRDKGVELHLMDMGGPVLHSSVSRLVFGILMMVANMESERIGERVASVKEHLRKQGRYLGGAMVVGYTKDANNQLKVSRDWRKHLATMKTLSEAGTSTRDIAATMKERGLAISHNTVYRVLVQKRKTDTVLSVA